MRMRWGTYRHRIAEVDLRISREPIANATGGILTYRELWQLAGRLYNRTGSAKGMDAIIREFEQAYSVNGQDLVLEHEDGTPSYHQLLSRNTIGGTRVISPPQFGEGRQGEYVSYRSYSVTIEAIRPILAGVSAFIEFQETVSVRGGGARFGVSEVNYGPGIRQRLRTHSRCVATQSGRATLFTGYPDPPPPIWPFALVDQFPDIQVEAPETISTGQGSDLINGTTSWTYNFEFPLRLAGLPHYLLR